MRSRLLILSFAAFPLLACGGGSSSTGPGTTGGTNTGGTGGTGAVATTAVDMKNLAFVPAAIVAHASRGDARFPHSEANRVIARFRALNKPKMEDLLGFLRSL